MMPIRTPNESICKCGTNLISDLHGYYLVKDNTGTHPDPKELLYCPNCLRVHLIFFPCRDDALYTPPKQSSFGAVLYSGLDPRAPLLISLKAILKGDEMVRDEDFLLINSNCAGTIPGVITALEDIGKGYLFTIGVDTIA